MIYLNNPKDSSSLNDDKSLLWLVDTPTDFVDSPSFDKRMDYHP